MHSALNLTPYIKNNAKWIIDLNVKAKNKRGNLCNLGAGQDGLNNNSCYESSSTLIKNLNRGQKENYNPTSLKYTEIYLLELYRLY